MITSILVGGLLGLLVAAWEGKLLASFRFVGLTLLRTFVPSVEVPSLRVRRNLPFGVAIALGTMVALIADRAGYTTPATMLGLG
jgi:prepilin signal peptidase PulO-like enzyme (type II secretory pathway)